VRRSGAQDPDGGRALGTQGDGPSFTEAAGMARMTGIATISVHTTSMARRVACVTGAANGIGRATARAFAREGAAVTVADASEQANQETARMIEAAGGRALGSGRPW
jgi:hypothetical protein